MNTCPYDPDGGSLCGACITLPYEEYSITILSGVTLAIYTVLGFISYNIRTAHFSRKIIKLYVLPIERMLFNLFLAFLWTNEFFLIHFWRMAPITVACPPSSVYMGLKIINSILSCFLFAISISTRDQYVFRFYIWIPTVLQCSTIFVYYIDAISREDICWSSFTVIPSLLLAVLNVVNLPYILMGKGRGIIGQEIEMNPLAISHSKGYRNNDDSLTDPVDGTELINMASRRYTTRADSDSDGTDGGIFDLTIREI